MAVTQSAFDRELEANLRNRDFDLNHRDVVELLEVVGETIHGCLQREMKAARKNGWGRTGKSRRPVKTEEKIANPSVIVRGVGKFAVRQYPARTGRNPQTGEKLKIPASQRMRMTVPKPLRDALGVK